MSGLTVEDFIAGHQGQLVSANVPQHFWSRLHDKLMGEVFDAGDYFQIICEESADDGRKNWQVVLTKDLEANDPNGIFLVDHAWTFRPQLARRHLVEVPGLLDRMSAFLGHDDDEAEEVDPRRRTDRVLRDLWRHAQTYTIRRPGATTGEDEMPVWYMADEFGSRIPHSDEPTVRMVPIYYAPQQIAFSLVFPLQTLKEGDLVTRDYADSATARARPNWRHLLLHPWTPIDISHQAMENVEPTEDFFLSGRTMDELPSGTVVRNVPIKLEDSDLKLKIFADDFQLIKHLIHVQYEVVEDMKDADVVWLRTHFHKFKELSVINPNALVNQFPFESILTVKDLLAVAVQNAYRGSGFHPESLETKPSWLQTTFNLNTELPEFISCYQNREKRLLDNTWIIKPWNLARGLDMNVCDDLGQIIRLIDSGPKIACKYIDEPVLFRRPDNHQLVKFDLRYIVFVRSVKPPVVYVYNNFWLRFAIKSFSLLELDETETHFTVFNYADKSKILQMECKEFIRLFEAQYPDVKWANIQQQINQVIREVVEAAARENPPRGVAQNAQSRAMYGVDLMLKWSKDANGDRCMDVSFLEANFMPDCERACQYYPDFADTVFRTLFFDESQLGPVQDKVTLV